MNKTIKIILSLILGFGVGLWSLLIINNQFNVLKWEYDPCPAPIPHVIQECDSAHVIIESEVIFLVLGLTLAIVWSVIFFKIINKIVRSKK